VYKRQILPPPIHCSFYRFHSFISSPLNMYRFFLALLATLALVSAAASDKLQVGVKYKPDDCPIKSRNGDRLSMQ
jgi:hypothetical protein